MHRVSHWFAASVLVALTACGDATGPVPQGTYVLAQLNGASLPYNHEVGCCIYLGGQIDLTVDHYAASIVARNRSTNTVFTVGEEGSYTQQGAVITFVMEHFTGQPLLMSTATVNGNVMRLAFGGEGPGSPDQFAARFEKQ